MYEGILVAVSFSEIAGESAKRHAVYLALADAISALDVHSEFSSRGFVGEREVRVKILLRTELNFEPVVFTELHEHREEQQLKHFGDDFGIY